MSTLTLTPLGGGTEIGANCFLVQCDGHDVLLDCGLHPKKEGLDALPEFSLLRRPPAAVVVSHAHIDHCGAVPYLMNEFPETVCYTTVPTAAIMDRMLHNSVSVMTRIGQEDGVPEYPLYTHRDVEYMFRRLYEMEFDHEFALSYTSPFRVSFRHAGHVLGSASILLKTPGHTVFYTGDVCMANQELLAGMSPLAADTKVDTLIIEATRGAQANGEDTTFESEIERFAGEVRKVLEGGGSVLVPSFALGRTQELLNVISRLMEADRLPRVPIYASGLGRAVYEIYDRHIEYLRPDATLRPIEEYGSVGDVWDPGVRRELLSKPGIIVATSGMMIENTPSAIISEEMVKHDRHGIFFVGYLDPDTLGYRLLNAEEGTPLIFSRKGRPVPVRLTNRQSFSFSAHAPREELMALIHRIDPVNVAFVHGDDDAIEWMSQSCNGRYRKFAPVLGEAISLEP